MAGGGAPMDMTGAELLGRTNGAYLCLVHPVRAGGRYRQEVAPVLALVPSVPDQVVASLLAGASWRERLLGLCAVVAKGRPEAFVEAVLRSLREPRGFAIVPACA